MATRFYSVQHVNPIRGWEDLRVYSKKEKPCIDYAEKYAQDFTCTTRVIRKPHSFTPSGKDTVLE